LSNNVRVTTSSPTSERVETNNLNAAVYASNSVTTTKANIFKDNNDRPWTAYYVTADEFFDILRIAFDDTYGGGSDTPWHPEDMYVNVLTTLEVVTNTLSNMANIKAGRPLKGLKEI
jgi:hypothetical protein